MLNVIKGAQRSPRRVLLYGTHGIGKSTWAAQAPKPIFLATEDGLSDIGADRTPLLTDLANVNGFLSDLLTQDHDYRTVVVDTLDWLERLIWTTVAREQNKPDIESIGYSKGYNFALRHWEFFTRSLDHLRSHRRMALILLAQAKAAKIEPPDADSYTRYEPDLHKTVAPFLQEWCDEVLFANYRVNVIARDEGFNRERTRAIGSGERVVYTTEMPTHLAKRRVKMPDVLPLDFNEYAKYLAAAAPPATPIVPVAPPVAPQVEASGDGDISGIVNNGSSKQLEAANHG